jgi:hypothetical protein
MYYVFLNELLLPINPSEIKITVGTRNETISLINDSEINILKSAPLKEISLSFIIPSKNYPFAHYHNLGLNKLMLLHIEKLKNQPFQFIIAKMHKNALLTSSNTKVSLEGYDITENAENGLDLICNMTLKEYRDFGTKKLIVKNGKATISQSR